MRETNRSQRFVKSARAERTRLERRRGRLEQKREAAQIKLDELNEALENIEREIRRLDELAEPHESVEAPGFLRGRQIRVLAIPLLLRMGIIGPIYYRDWLQILLEGGYQVAGQRPEAVFLGQVMRSPLVRATTKAGYYELDLDAVDRLRKKLREQRAELAQQLAREETSANLARHHQMVMAVSRTRRELVEVEEAIEAAKSPQLANKFC